MFVLLLFTSCALAGIYAAPLSSDGVRRQQLSLYGDPLTHDQIIQLIKDHMNSKRQQLSLYGDPLTHDQIIQLIKDHMNSKRQQPSLYGDPLTHDQIIQLIKDHMNSKRQQPSLYGDPLTHDQIIQLIKDHMTSTREAHGSLLHSVLHTLTQLPHDLQSNGHVSPLLSVETIDQPTWTALVSDLSYDDILNILGELWKTH